MMIKFLASLISGSSDFRPSLEWVDRIADEIGADRKVFASSLTEAGVNYAMWMKMFEQAADDQPDERDRLRSFALMLIPRAEQGLLQMASRFGMQPQIAELASRMEAYSSRNDSNQDAGESPEGTVMHLIFHQLPLCGLDPLSLAQKLYTDNFALGYVFGMSDMGHYQFNRNSSAQSDAIAFIGTVFTETLGSHGQELFVAAMSKQSTAIFAEGREQGASELGSWLKSQGQVVPFGLANHFGDSTEG